MTTQEKILDNYDEIRGAFLDSGDKQKQIFFNMLAKFSYHEFIKQYKDKKVLEIGCNKGYLLKALQDLGFRDLYGIDLCEDDLKKARKRTGLNTLKKEDLFMHLQDNKYDLIICKDVMEHIQKDKQEKFVACLYNALNENGGGYGDSAGSKYGLDI